MEPSGSYFLGGSFAFGFDTCDLDLLRICFSTDHITSGGFVSMKHTCTGDWNIDQCPGDHARTEEDLTELEAIYPDVKYREQLRRAEVRTSNRIEREQIETYLPSNYRITKVVRSDSEHTGVFTIEGRDNAGWTLDGYVLPRLASGLYFGVEVSV